MKKYIFLAIIPLLFFNGCSEDFLDTKSTTQVDESTVFSDLTAVTSLVGGMHKLMWTADLSTSASFGGYDMLMIWFDMLGEDLVYTYSNAQFQSQARWGTHRNNTGASSLRHYYRLLQYFITNASSLINSADQIVASTEDMISKKNNNLGQAHFYRAFAYFTMAQMWGERYKAGGNNTQPGVIIRNDESVDNRARNTVEEVYEQVNSDLDEAIRYLTATKVVRPDKSHINLHVARGLKARVLLTQSKWLEAAEMAKLVVEQSGAKLQDDTYTTFDKRFSDQSNTEWLWGSKPELKQGKELTHFHGYMSNDYVSYNGNTPRAIYNLLYNKISSTDVRKNIWFPEGGITSTHTADGPLRSEGGSKRYANYMANKYIISKTAPSSWGTYDVPFMRLPEMMLVMAEGYARAGGHDADAQAALYPLAYHRDPQYVKSVKTGADLIDEVMFQRRVELWGEGFRWLDLKRLNLPLDRGPAPREGYEQRSWTNGYSRDQDKEDPEASNFNRYGDGTVIGETNRYREAGHKEWQWLFYEPDTQLNPLMVQNPL